MSAQGSGYICKSNLKRKISAETLCALAHFCKCFRSSKLHKTNITCKTKKNIFTIIPCFTRDNCKTAKIIDEV